MFKLYIVFIYFCARFYTLVYVLLLLLLLLLFSSSLLLLLMFCRIVLVRLCVCLCVNWWCGLSYICVYV